MAASRTKKILAIDWDARNLRIVHALLTKRGVNIDRIFTVGIPADVDPAAPEAMGKLIRNALDQEGIGTRHAIVDIPRDQAVLKTLVLPVADPETMAGIVRIQIAKELPFPVDDAVIDFAMEAPEHRPGDGEGAAPGTTDVLVAAVRHELRDQYTATFAAAGLKLDRIGLRPYANKVAVARLLEFSMPERVLVIDVRPNLTEIDVLKKGALAFSRAASVVVPDQLLAPEDKATGQAGDADTERPRLSIAGSEPSQSLDLSDPAARPTGAAPPRPLSPVDKFINSVVQEVTRSIEAYRAGDPGSTVDHVVIGGDVGVEERLAEVIQSRLNLTTELYNPASTFGWEPDEGAAASAFSATLGLVLGHAETDALHFDFLHPKRAGTAARARLMKAPSIAAVIALFLASGAVGLTQYRKDDRATLKRIEREIEELEGNRSNNRKFDDLMRELRAFDAGQHVWVDVLYEVFSKLPQNKDLVVDHLDMQQDQGRVTLKTRTKERDTPLNVVRELEAFRRPGRDKQRFKVTMGPQAEKKGDEYPFSQELRIEVLDDTPSKKATRT